MQARLIGMWGFLQVTMPATLCWAELTYHWAASCGSMAARYKHAHQQAAFAIVHIHLLHHAQCCSNVLRTMHAGKPRLF